MDITDILIAPPPKTCEVYGNKLRDSICKATDKITQVMHFCPHHHSLILAHLENNDRQGSIV